MSNQYERPGQTGEGQLFMPDKSLVLPDVFTSRPEMLSQLTTQVGFFMDAARRTPEEREIVLEITKKYLETRFRRGQEIALPKVQDAAERARTYFDEARDDGEHVHVEFNLCMDMRVRKTLVLGVPGGFGNSIRFPGGRPEGFSRIGFGPGLELDTGSYYAAHIDKMNEDYPITLRVLDSHYGCQFVIDAEKDVTGVVPVEAGVRKDRQYKNEMVPALHASTERPGEGEVTYLQTSFNPKNGYVDFLSETKIEEPVLSMEEMAYGSLQALFEKNEFEADWLNDYVETADKFWQNMLRMQDRGLPIIREQMKKSFSNTAKEDPMKLELMARFGFANAYEGYLSNLNREYPHGKHKEDLVVATIRGEDGPFPETEAFEIFRESDDLRDAAMYATGLVRKFRQIGKVETPVPLVLLHTIADPSAEAPELAMEVAEELQRIDWQNMDHKDVKQHLIERYGEENEVSNAIAEMVKVMKNIYNRRKQDSLRDAVYTGTVVPIPVLSDQRGTPIAVVPFTLKAA